MRDRAAVISVVARDRAQRVIDQLTTKVNTANQGFLRWGSTALRLTSTMGFLHASLLAVSAAIPALIVAQSVVAFTQFEQASRRARLQLQVMGVDAANATSAIGRMAEALDRATATTFFLSREAIANLGIAGTELGQQLVEMASDMESKFGIPMVEAFNALFAARVLDDPTLLQNLVGDFGKFGDLVAGFDLTTTQGIIDFLIFLSDRETLTRVEGLADSFQRIAELTMPTRDMMAEFVAGFIDVFITSFAEVLEEQKENWKLSIIAGLGTAFFLAGAPLAARLVGGVGAAIVAIMAVNLSQRISDALNDPLFSVPVLALAFFVGQRFGGSLIGGIVASLTLQLFPGIKKQFDLLAEEEQSALIAAASATAIALAFRARFTTALAIGTLARELVLSLLTPEGNFPLWGVVGAIIGARFGGAVGAAAGFIIGEELGRFIPELPSMFGDILKWSGRMMGVTFANAFLTATDAMFRALERSVNSMVNIINGLIRRAVSALRSVGLWRGGAAPQIGGITLPNIDLLPFPAPPFAPGEGNQNIPSIPGAVGLPGGTGQGGTTTINLVLDGQILTQVVMDNFSKDLKFRQDLSPGMFSA